MIIIKTEKEIKEKLDKPTQEFINESIFKDANEFIKKELLNENEWISKVLLFRGSNHSGTKIPFGFLLRYQFRKISVGLDTAIREIRVPEDNDELLDLINEIQNNSEIFNKQFKK